VFFAIEEKREPKESEYFWHIPIFVLYATKIGIIFDTTNISDKY
jgi:hypothetical protein